MNILHVYKTYVPTSFGGTERVIQQIVGSTAALDVRSEVFSLADGTRTGRVDDHVGIYVRRDAKVASTDLSLRAFRHFARAAVRADLVHYHVPWPQGDLLHFFGARRKPSVVTYHSDIVRQRRLKHLYGPLMHAFLGRVDRIVATSPAYAETSPVLKRHRDKVRVIPIGLDERASPAPAEVERLRQRVGSGFFLFVGELRYYKGLSFLLDAARRSGQPIVIAGSGEMAEEIVRAAISNVTFLGRVTDEEKEALLELCGAFVFPSHLRSEAFGVALLEAARAGRAMICCELGTGTTYINRHGETGLAVPPADSAALAAAMQQLASMPAERDAMGRRARARYAELFTGHQMGLAYHALYAEVLELRM